MYTQVSQRLAEGASGPVFYPQTEIIAALNEGNRFFCLLTLALEATKTWTVSAATTFFHMMTVSGFADWIVPLRIANASGQKIRPASVDTLNSLNPAWMASPGTPARYASLGSDLIALYSQPAGGGTVLTVTYARAPTALAADGDIPEVPATVHPHLVNYGIYRMRQGEGGGEFQKALPLLDDFLSAAEKYADYMRARNEGADYDTGPFELQAFDRSPITGRETK